MRQRLQLLLSPLEMLLRSCPERLYLLLVISVTSVTSVGVDKLEPVLHQAEEFIERFTSASCSSLQGWLSVCPLHSCWNFLTAGSIFACCSSIRMRSGSAHTLPIPHSSAAAMIIIVVFVFVFMAE